MTRRRRGCKADRTSPQPDKLFEAYSSGKIPRRILEEKTGLWFGEILQELGKRGLSLPRVDSTVYYNSRQMALYNSIFNIAAREPAARRKNVQRANRFVFR